MHLCDIIQIVVTVIAFGFRKNVVALEYSHFVVKEFTFPGQQNQPGPAPLTPAPRAGAPTPATGNANHDLSARQLVTGVVPTLTPTNSLGPTIVNNDFTCICVPVGQCSGTPTDGSGIDIRIVNNPGATNPPGLICAAGLVVCCRTGPYRCGERYPPIQGSPPPTPPQAAFGEYPWQAVILTSGDVYLGSGAIISNQHILTAAHKIANIPGNTYKIRVGEWDAAVTTEPIPAQEYAIGAVAINPNYNPSTLQNSIAIITLATQIPLGRTPTIASICLPLTSFTGQRCFVSGWGKNDFGPNGQYQAIQKEVDVLVRSTAECQAALSRTRLGSSFVFNGNTFVCAGGEAGKDACTGDGGSPLACQLGGRWFVAGLVAWGIGCGQEGVPGVYVNVANYVPWIQSIVSTI